jgi:hypothetical protein
VVAVYPATASGFEPHRASIRSRFGQGPLGVGAYAMHRERLGIVCSGPTRDNMVKLRYGDREKSELLQAASLKEADRAAGAQQQEAEAEAEAEAGADRPSSVVVHQSRGLVGRLECQLFCHVTAGLFCHDEVDRDATGDSGGQ